MPLRSPSFLVLVGSCLLLAGTVDAEMVTLIYTPETGNVMIDTDGLTMNSFGLQNDPTPPNFRPENADYSELPAPTFSVASAVELGWAVAEGGFMGVANIGDVFPIGFASVAEVESFLSLRTYTALEQEGMQTMGVAFIPEPSSAVLWGPVALLAGGLWRRRGLRRRAA